MKRMWAAREASAPESMHSEMGSSRMVWGSMAERSLIQLNTNNKVIVRSGVTGPRCSPAIHSIFAFPW